MDKYSTGWNNKKHKQKVEPNTRLRAFRNPMLLENILVATSKRSGDSITAIIIKALKKFLGVK